MKNDQMAGGGLSRRRFVLGGAQTALAVGGASWLAACTSGGASSGETPPRYARATTTGAAASAGGETSIRGGTFRVGMMRGGSAETCNPEIATLTVDQVRVRRLFDGLFGQQENVETLRPALARTAEPNADATVWTVELRDGVTSHDGKSFGADDGVWTIKSWADEASYAHGYVDGERASGSVALSQSYDAGRYIDRRSDRCASRPGGEFAHRPRDAGGRRSAGRRSIRPPVPA